VVDLTIARKEKGAEVDFIRRKRSLQEIGRPIESRRIILGQAGGGRDKAEFRDFLVVHVYGKQTEYQKRASAAREAPPFESVEKPLTC